MFRYFLRFKGCKFNKRNYEIVSHIYSSKFELFEKGTYLVFAANM